MKTPPFDVRIVVALIVPLILPLMGAVGAATAVAAPAAPDPKATSVVGSAPSPADLEARDLFRSQRYADALVVYQRLRTETGHPTYLRNIGRCHQMMRQPTQAIDAFGAYLRDARDLNTAERTEIEGYIAEMRRLELSAPPPSNVGAPATVTTPLAVPSAATTSPPAVASVATTSPPAVAPAATPSPPAVAPAAAGATAAPDPAGSSSITHKWWFWTGIGILAAASGIIIIATSGQDRLTCPTGAVCP